MLYIKPCDTKIHSLVGIYAIIKSYALIESLSPTFGNCSHFVVEHNILLNWL